MLANSSGLADAERLRVLVSYRAQRYLEPDVRASVAEASDLDLEAFYASAEGAAALLAYLRKRHRKLPLDAPLGEGGRSLADELLERAERRFLWVFHLARGLEVGFLDLATASASWPTADAFYSRYLTWLEARAAHHPGYVGTLRRVLLTLSLSPSPLNDRTLLWLLDIGPESNAEAEQAVYRAWLRPVLDDLADFLLRYRVDPRRVDQPTADRIAAAIIEPEAQVEPTHAMVRRVAHRTLSDFLRDGEVGAEWEIARESAREELAARMASGLGALSREQVDTASAPLRYVQQHAIPLLTATHADTTMVPHVDVYLAAVPDDFSVTPNVWRWTAALKHSAAALDIGAGDALERRRAHVLGRLGEALGSNQEAGEAVAVHRVAVRICQGLAGLSEAPNEAALQKAVSERTGLVRELAIGLNRLGSALESNQEAGEAVEVHRLEVRLWHALAGLSEEPDEAALQKAVSERTGPVRELAIGLNRLGAALGSNQEGGRAVGVHRLEVRLKRALAGLSEEPDEEALQKAVSKRTGLVRLLATGLGSLGRALRLNQEAQEAVGVHRLEVRLSRALAGLSEESDEEALQKAASARVGPVRDLAIGLGSLGSALGSNEEAGEAVGVHRLEMRVWHALAGLSEEPDEAALQKAVSERRGLVRELAIGLNRLGTSLRLNQEAGEAVAVHRLEVRLSRALVGLSEAPDEEALQKAVSERTGLVRDLAIGLGRLGEALGSNQEAGEAVGVHRLEVRLIRALAGLSEAPDEEALQKAVSERRGLVRDLAIGLNRLGTAQRLNQEGWKALAVHRLDVRLSRALVGLSEAPDEEALQKAVSERSGLVRDLAIGLGSLGLCLWTRGSNSAAIDSTERALALWDALTRHSPQLGRERDVARGNLDAMRRAGSVGGNEGQL